SGDGKWFLTLEEPPRMQTIAVGIWSIDPRSPDSGLTLRPGHRVMEIAISRDGNVIATANEDQTVSLWQRSTQSELHILPHKQYVRALTFSPDGQELMTGEFDGGLVQWNVKEGKEIERWTLPVLGPMRAGTPIVRIEYLPNGEEVASVSLAQLL